MLSAKSAGSSRIRAHSELRSAPDRDLASAPRSVAHAPVTALNARKPAQLARLLAAPAVQALGCVLWLQGCSSELPSSGGLPVAGPAANSGGSPATSSSGGAAAPARSAGAVSSPPLGAAGAAGTALNPIGPMLPSAGGSAADAGTRPVTPPDPSDDAGVTDVAAPSCDPANGWQLAPGFVLSQHVDYVEDRNDQRMPSLLSSAGKPCATAQDRANCQTNLALPTSFGRLLVTTTGDDVRYWTAQAAFTLLGAIDTESEALWVASLSYELPCSTTVSRASDGFIVDGIPATIYSCMQPDAKPTIQIIRAKIRPDASFEQLSPDPSVIQGCKATPAP